MQVYDENTAPEPAAEMLQDIRAKYGFVPNLLGIMAGAPALLRAYLSLSELISDTSFSPTEQQVILLEASRQNECHYCVAAHSIIAAGDGVSAEVVEAIRNGREMSDPKLEALRRFTAQLVQTRGWPSAAVKQQFLEAGYSEAQALEVVLGVGMKTLSNYTNHLAGTELDEQFAAAAWQPENQ